MTVKGKRRGSIGKITPEEAKRQGIQGGAVTSSLPFEAISALEKMKLPEPKLTELCERLGGYVGRYWENAASPPLPVAQELKFVRDTVEIIGELRDRLKAIPDLVRVRTDEVLWDDGRGHHWHELQQVMDQHLKLAVLALSSGAREAETYGGNAGRRKSSDRDALVRRVAAEIEASLPSERGARTQAASMAHAVLSACNVPVPGDLHEFQRLARESGKNCP